MYSSVFFLSSWSVRRMHFWFELIINLPGHFCQKEAMIQVFNRVTPIFKESSLEFLLGLDGVSAVELFPTDLSIMTLLLSVPNVTKLSSLMQYSMYQKEIEDFDGGIILWPLCLYIQYLFKIGCVHWIYILHIAIILSLVQCFYILYVTTWLHEINAVSFFYVFCNSVLHGLSRIHKIMCTFI